MTIRLFIIVSWHALTCFVNIACWQLCYFMKLHLVMLHACRPLYRTSSQPMTHHSHPPTHWPMYSTARPSMDTLIYEYYHCGPVPTAHLAGRQMVVCDVMLLSTCQRDPFTMHHNALYGQLQQPTLTPNKLPECSHTKKTTTFHLSTFSPIYCNLDLSFNNLIWFWIVSFFVIL